MRLRCLLGHDWEEQAVEKASAYRDGTIFTGLKHVEYECSRCNQELISVMTPGQLKWARETGKPPRSG